MTRQAADAEPSGADAEEQLTQLRRLIGGVDRERVQELARHVEDPAVVTADVARVLPQSIVLRASQDDRLASALYPTVEGAMRASVKRNPKVLIDVIFPVLGPAIRKAVRESIAGLVQAINRNVESTFTLRGLKWRLEAWRTGRSLGEVLLSKSLVYRVEQVFFLHGETGILLCHASVPEAVGTENADVISSMLTALQDFVRDSFGMEAGEGLDQFRAGERIILVERGPRGVVAASVLGDPTPAVAASLTRVVEELHEGFGAQLRKFQGDTAPFVGSRPTLETCFLEERKVVRRSVLVPIVLSAASVVAGVWILVQFFNNLSADRQFEKYRALLEAEPGYLIVHAEEDGDRYRVLGLRDPQAQDPLRLMERAGLEPGSVDSRWVPWHSQHAAFVLTRVRSALSLGDGVRMTLTEDGALEIAGDLTPAQRSGIPLLASLTPSVREVILRGTGPVGATLLRAHAAEVEATVFTFAERETALGAGGLQQARALNEVLRDLDRAAADLGHQVTVTFLGYTSRTGDPGTNRRLSVERAEGVLRAVESGTWRATTFAAEGRGEAEEPLAIQDASGPRRVSCAVRITPELPESPR